jgi:CBS domain-containing protein
MKVKDLSRVYGRTPITVGENNTVDVAIGKLLEHRIGALPVCNAKGALVGIISERDLLGICSSRPDEVAETRCKDVMVKDVAVCVPDDDLNYVMNIMTQKAIRHMPIMAGGKPSGIISIRDIMEERLEACEIEVRHLSDYISGGYI